MADKTTLRPQAFPSFLGHTVVTGEAAGALVRLCSDPDLVDASTPAHRNVPEDWQNPGPKFNSISQSIAEGLRRLRGLVSATEAGDELAAGRRQLLAVLEGQEFPWDVSASDYMSIAEQVAS